MGIKDRLRRLEGDEPERCEEAPCLRGISTVETVVCPDGTRETTGGPLPPLCERCPVRRGEGPIRRVEVVRSYSGTELEGLQPAHAGRVVKAIESHSAMVERPPNERGARELASRVTEDPDEHAEDEALAYMRRRQQREDEAFAKARARRRNRGGPTFDPEDFGVT